jgi:hypothetical protein
MREATMSDDIDWQQVDRDLGLASPLPAPTPLPPPEPPAPVAPTGDDDQEREPRERWTRRQRRAERKRLRAEAQEHPTLPLRDPASMYVPALPLDEQIEEPEPEPEPEPKPSRRERRAAKRVARAEAKVERAKAKQAALADDDDEPEPEPEPEPVEDEDPTDAMIRRVRDRPDRHSDGPPSAEPSRRSGFWAEETSNIVWLLIFICVVAFIVYALGEWVLIEGPPAEAPTDTAVPTVPAD